MILDRVTAIQVSKRLMGIAKCENLQLSSETIYKIATMANGDIRQMLNMMQMHHVSNKHMSNADASKFVLAFYHICNILIQDKHCRLTTKETSIGLFEVLPKLFDKNSYSQLSQSEKIQLYFTDPGMVPLFVQVGVVTTGFVNE